MSATDLAGPGPRPAMNVVKELQRINAAEVLESFSIMLIKTVLVSVEKYIGRAIVLIHTIVVCRFKKASAWKGHGMPRMLIALTFTWEAWTFG